MKQITSRQSMTNEFYGIAANVIVLTDERGRPEYQVTITDLDADETFSCSKTFPTFIQAVDYARTCVR